MASGRTESTRNQPTSGLVVIDQAQLPPVKTVVQISFQDTHGGAEPKAVYFSRIVMRRRGFDYLDAMRDQHGEVTNAWGDTGSQVRLWWGQDHHLWEYPIRIEEVLEPVVALEVAYLGPARRHNRRQEARAHTTVPAQFHVILDQDAPSTDDGSPPSGSRSTETRDISYAGVRFFSPESQTPGSMIHLSVRLPEDSAWFSASAQVLRCTKSIVLFGGKAGYDVVSLWSPPLEGETLDRWTQFFNQHRYD